MNAKDFILSLNEEKLLDIYCQRYCKLNTIRHKTEPGAMKNKKKFLKRRLKYFLNQVKQIKPIETSDEILWGRTYWDYDIVDDGKGGWKYPLIKFGDVSIVNKEDWKFNLNPQLINTFEERDKNFYIVPYSLMYIDPAYILGLEIFNQGDDYKIAADILHELTWFGYNLKRISKHMKQSEDMLEQRYEEVKEAIETGEIEKSKVLDDIKEDIGISDGTFKDKEEIEKWIEEETKEMNARLKEVCLLNYNLSVMYYNDLNPKLKEYWKYDKVSKDDQI